MFFLAWGVIEEGSLVVIFNGVIGNGGNNQWLQSTATINGQTVACFLLEEALVLSACKFKDIVALRGHGNGLGGGHVMDEL